MNLKIELKEKKDHDGGEVESLQSSQRIKDRLNEILQDGMVDIVVPKKSTRSEWDDNEKERKGNGLSKMVNKIMKKKDGEGGETSVEGESSDSED